jgi:hemolysin activation/secretion protein
MKRSRLFAVAIGLVLLMGMVSAMAADPLPVAVEPGRLEQRFEQPPEPRATGEALIPESKAMLPPDQAGQIRFHLTAVEIEDATVFAADDFRAFYADLLGREVSLLDIYQVAAKATARYGNAGYLLSRVIVPAQTVSNGTVRLLAVEGYIDRVVIMGKPHGQSEFFDLYAEKIKASRPLHNSVIERYLLLANDLPGTRVQSVLRPSADNTGAATLTLTVMRTRYNGMASIDNRGSKAIGRWQALLEGNVNGFWGGADRNAVLLATTPEDTDELHYVALSHSQVLNREGTSLDLSFTWSESEPGENFMRLLEVETESRSAGISLAHPVQRSRAANLTLSGGFAWRDSETMQLGEKTAEDRLYFLHMGLLHDRADATGVNLLALTLSQGLDLGNAQVETRAGAKEDFTKLEFYASRTQRLTEEWSATLRVGGQVSGSGLPASEQFGIGGETFGRAFDPSEWTGDNGAAASLEVSRRLWLTDSIEGRPYLFCDTATVRRRHPLNEAKYDSADSAGLGVRLSFPRGLSLAVEAAKPLANRAIPDESKDWRYFLRAMAKF